MRLLTSNSDSKGNAGRRFRINGSKRRQVRREKAAFGNPAGSEQIDTEAFKYFDAPMHILALGVIRNAREENQKYFWDKYSERQRDSDNGSGFLVCWEMGEITRHREKAGCGSILIRQMLRDASASRGPLCHSVMLRCNTFNIPAQF